MASGRLMDFVRHDDRRCIREQRDFEHVARMDCAAVQRVPTEFVRADHVVLGRQQNQLTNLDRFVLQRLAGQQQRLAC